MNVVARAVATGVVVLSILVMAPTSMASDVITSPSGASADVAADCSVPVEKRLAAASDAAIAAKEPGVTGTFEQSLQATFRYLHLCRAESVSFARDGGGELVVGPKAAGEPLPFSTDFSHVGMRTMASTCEYVALLPKVQYGSVITFKGWLKARCPVVATWKSTTCTDLKYGGSWHPNCNYSGQANNWPADTWWEHFGPQYTCISTYDYRSKADPSRFANGAWAGPGWIYSGARFGVNFC